jgi:hypothetical protein
MLTKNLFSLILCTISLLNIQSVSESRSVTKVDICIYGGTPAGVMAGYTARKMGKTVLLIEPGRHLEGLSSGELGFTDIAENLFTGYMQRAKANVLFSYRVRDVSKTGAEISSIVIESSDHPEPASNRIIEAKIFLDCTYEGELMARAGVAHTEGREPGIYNETSDGVQLRDTHQFIDGIDTYKKKGQRQSWLLGRIGSESLLPQGSGDNKVQVYPSGSA